MPGKCDLCGKTPLYGHNVSHSKRRTNRRWMPNVQKRMLFLNGRRVRVSVCSRCLRTLYKAQ
jgi:large subunit ribosomal protein L28